MHETAEDLGELQRVIDASYDSAGEHIRTIFRPELRSSAEDLARALAGIFIINLATVTARGEPVVAPVDGLFYRGRLFFGLPPRSLRARHVRARPPVSATHMEGELPNPGGRCLIVHGVAREVTYGHPLHAGYSRYVLPLYGLVVPDDLDAGPTEQQREDFTGYIEPRRIYAQGYGATS